MIYFLSFIITLILTPLVWRVAVANGITDKAGSDPLKIHKEPVALLGGVAILTAMIVGFWVSAINWSQIFVIMGGGLIIFGVGLWDDVKGIKPIVRLLIQVLGGIVVLLAGIRVNFIPVLWISMPITVFYIAGAINALNVTDGMDGLCTGISLVSCVGFFFLGLEEMKMPLVYTSAVLFMSLLGFLPYNFYPAKIFLGDAGSGFLGFMLGAMAVMATSKPFNFVSFIAPILIICVPVLDMAFAILRRLLRKKPLFVGDRVHVYDILLKRGWSQPKVWSVMCGVQAVMVVIALILVGM